jgi:hypothetical protein
MANFTPTQGRYLAFIHAYTARHGYPPSEAEIAAALLISPPAVNQMVMMLEKKGLISRRPGTPRSIRVLVPESELPPWGGSKRAGRSTLSGRPPETTAGGWAPAASSSPPADLYVLAIFLLGGPVGLKFSGKEISRVIEIRGDQTLDQLHQAIFEAYDRWEQHAYEFQFGRRPHDPAGPNYGVAAPAAKTKGGNARKKTLDELDLKVHRVFGYWFDFGDDWYHQVHVERIAAAIPTVSYPRVTRRIGKSPPQYTDRQS